MLRRSGARCVWSDWSPGYAVILQLHHRSETWTRLLVLQITALHRSLRKDSLYAEQVLQPESDHTVGDWWECGHLCYLTETTWVSAAERDREDAALVNKLKSKRFRSTLRLKHRKIFQSHDFSHSWADESRHSFYWLLLLDDIKSWVKMNPQRSYSLATHQTMHG